MGRRKTIAPCADCPKLTIHTRCAKCRKLRAKSQNNQAYLAKRRAYRKVYKAKKSMRNVPFTPRQWIARLFNIRKSGAKSVDIDFNITVDDVLDLWTQQEGRCALSNVQMTTMVKHPLAASLDRIDSELGYSQNNIQLVCSWLNFSKGIYTHAEVVALLHQTAIALGYSKN